MALQVPVYEGGANYRQALIGFVKAVDEFLDELVKGNRDGEGEPLFIESLWRIMGPAWEEGRHEFQRIAIGLAVTSDGRLIEHGLGGMQLRYKLGVVRYFNEQYQKLGKRMLKRLLESIDTLLKSIIKAVGLGDAAEELKDYIEQCIDD